MAEVYYFTATKNKEDHRTVTTPATLANYNLPLEVSGNFQHMDLYGYGSATAYVYADVAVTVLVRASLLGVTDETSFFEMSGYSIAVGAFVTSKWNIIDLPIALAKVSLRVTCGVVPPADLRMALVAKV